MVSYWDTPVRSVLRHTVLILVVMDDDLVRTLRVADVDPDFES